MYYSKLALKGGDASIQRNPAVQTVGLCTLKELFGGALKDRAESISQVRIKSFEASHLNDCSRSISKC